MTDLDARHIGDGVERAGRAVERNAEIARAGLVVRRHGRRENKRGRERAETEGKGQFSQESLLIGPGNELGIELAASLPRPAAPGNPDADGRGAAQPPAKGAFQAKAALFRPACFAGLRL